MHCYVANCLECSFGIMMWEVYLNKPAYQGMHYGAVVEHVVVQKVATTP